MEVPGRKAPSALSSLSCQPCQRDGDTVNAEGYCENCNEFICTSCIKAHRKLAVTTNHVIKSKEEMPNLQAQIDPCTELCYVHKNEIVKFYCREHDSVGCGDCIVLNHASCKIHPVSDVSCNYENSDELVLIKHKIDHLSKNLASCKEKINRSLKTADEIKTDVVKEIKEFRKEMEDYLDKIEADLLREVDEVNERDVSSQKKLQDQCGVLADEIELFQAKLDRCKDKVNNLFVTAKRIQESLQKCQEINEEISSNSQINDYKFSACKEISNLKTRNTCLGNLETKLMKFSGQGKKTLIENRIQFVKKINVHTKKDKNCFISGMAIISETEILCADQNNSSLKVFNHREDKVKAILKTTTCPFDITTIDSSSAATTLPYEGKIMFLNTQNGLTESYRLDVREWCQGIDHRDGKIAVSFVEPPAVQVIDKEGNILHEVGDTSMLKYPHLVSLSRNNESIFVTDLKNSAVYEFNLKGNLQSINKRGSMNLPAGLTVTNRGYVVVCYLDKSDMFGVIVPGTTHIFPLHTRTLHDSFQPYSVIISEKQRKMFMSESSFSKYCNYIKIFELE
jgi:hypothetical protein